MAQVEGVNRPSSPVEIAVTDDGTVPLIEDAETRFLFPFFFQQDQAVAAAVLLLADKMPDGAVIWECGLPHASYRDEFFSHVTEQIFGPLDGSARCTYVQLSVPLAKSWFRNQFLVRRRDHKGSSISGTAVFSVGIECFLVDEGVGVLSITLKPNLKDHDSSELIDFNYRLCGMGHRARFEIYLPHPEDDPDRKIPPDARLPPRPLPDAKLPDRLGHPGGSFTLEELVNRLLKPIDCATVRARSTADVGLHRGSIWTGS